MDDEQFRERLANEIATWQREGLISEPQARAILAREGTDAVKTVRAMRLGWFATAVSVIGAIALAAGVVLLFASNWEEMPSWLRVGAVFAGMAIAYGSGYELIYRYGMQRVGSALILLGALLFEAGLFLVTQIYNLPIEDAGGTLFGLAALGILPLAYLFGSRIILLLGLANITMGVFSELVVRYPDSPETQSVLIVIAALGIAMYAIGRLHELRSALAHFMDVYVFAGLLVLIALVYVFSFDEPWSAMIDDGVESYAAPAVVYVSITLALALVCTQWLLRPRDVETHIEAGAQGTLLVLAAVVATWPGWTGYSVVFNAVYFAIAAGVVTHGYLRGDERYINAGLLAVAVGLITRYIDVFGEVLPASAFFLTGGALLLGLAFALERMRRGLLGAMSGDPGAKGAAA